MKKLKILTGMALGLMSFTVQVESLVARIPRLVTNL